MSPVKNQSSAKARRSAARLHAVQTLYQSLVLGQTPENAASQTVLVTPSDELGGETLIVPDEDLKKKILKTVQDNQSNLSQMLQVSLGERKFELMEPLLQSILLAAAAEINLKQYDIPILINDYVNIARAFYAGSEPGFVNGVLQGLIKE